MFEKLKGNLHIYISNIFCFHEVEVVCYAILVQAKSYTNCEAYFAKSIFQTHSMIIF